MSIAVESVPADFAAIVGESRVAADSVARQDHAVEGVVPSLVVYPQSAEQVAAALECAAGHSLAVIPCGRRTKIATGNPPRRYDVALSLKDLNRVWYYEPEDLVISVEPGMKLADLQRFVGRDRLWLPLDPAGGGRATIGGTLAANSSGPLRTAYGSARDMVLGMKISTTEGRIVKTGGRVVKNVTGYDISKVMIGSLGTLGVIVEASFKLFPQPAATATFVLAAGTLEKARELRRAIQQSPLQPMRLALLDAVAASRARQGAAAGRFEIWVEAAGSPRVLARFERSLKDIAHGSGTSTDCLEAETAQTGWSCIANFREAFARAEPETPPILKAAMPISASEDFMGRVEQLAAGGPFRLATLALPAVGVVHLMVLEGPRADGLIRFVGEVRKTAAALGGSLVVEWCPTELKSQIDVWGPPDDDFEVMRGLKEGWDPKGILSPGRFVGRL